MDTTNYARTLADALGAAMEARNADQLAASRRAGRVNFIESYNMAKYLLLAMTNPVAGHDREFNEWYDNMPYPTYKSIPGLIPLGRFQASLKR